MRLSMIVCGIWHLYRVRTIQDSCATNAKKVDDSIRGSLRNVNALTFATLKGEGRGIF